METTSQEEPIGFNAHEECGTVRDDTRYSNISPGKDSGCDLSSPDV
jgi:hypothetical protein